MFANTLQVIETLSKGGADIQELNTVRKAISQTKGGKLAKAAFPAKVELNVEIIGDRRIFTTH
jgi:glycerate-2-kinase